MCRKGGRSGMLRVKAGVNCKSKSIDLANCAVTTYAPVRVKI
jgi:hypothetical protein